MNSRPNSWTPLIGLLDDLYLSSTPPPFLLYTQLGQVYGSIAQSPLTQTVYKLQTPSF